MKKEANEEVAEIGTHRHRDASEVGKPRLYLRIGKSSGGLLLSLPTISTGVSLGTAMPLHELVSLRIAPVQNAPGLIAYECPSCGYVTSVLIGPQSGDQGKTTVREQRGSAPHRVGRCRLKGSAP